MLQLEFSTLLRQLGNHPSYRVKERSPRIGCLARNIISSSLRQFWIATRYRSPSQSLRLMTDFAGAIIFSNIISISTYHWVPVALEGIAKTTIMTPIWVFRVSTYANSPTLRYSDLHIHNCQRLLLSTKCHNGKHTFPVLSMMPIENTKCHFPPLKDNKEEIYS